MGVRLVGYRLRTTLAVVVIDDPVVVLGTFEIRQDLVVAPTTIASLGPAVLILALATDVDHRIDGA